MRYPHLAARIFNTPLLIHPQKLDAIIAGLGPRLLGAALAPVTGGESGSDLLAPELFSTRRGERSDGGYMVSEGVAVIRVMGALAHRSKLDADSSYVLGYNEVATKLEHAMQDPAVHAVAAIVDSPGGEAQGAYELAQRTMDFRGKKPQVALADSMALSAGYLFASAADEVVVTSGTAYVGSIGVVMRHVDFSRMLANEGISVTHIFAGAHKVDGNQFEALPASVRADLQGEINKLYEMFVSAVVRHTGLSAEAVRATGARCYMGEDAVRMGLAKRMASTDQILTELAGRRVRTYPVGQSARATSANDKGASMSGNNPAADGTQSANQATFTAADLERARAEGHAAGAAAERERIQAVESALMPGHEALISSLKFDGKTSGGEAALAVLKAERELRDQRGKAHLNDAPAALQLRPSSTVRSEGGKSMSRSELDQKAKDYVAAHPGTSYVQAVKFIEQQGA